MEKIAFPAFLVSFIGLSWFYLNRDRDFNFPSYPGETALYVDPGKPILQTSWKNKEGGISFQFTGLPEYHGFLLIDGVKIGSRHLAPLILPPLAGRHYIQLIAGTDSLAFYLDQSASGGSKPWEITAARGFQFQGGLHLPLSTWDNRSSRLPVHSLERELLAGNPGTGDSGGISTIRHLAAGLGAHFQRTTGVPQPGMEALHPMEQLRKGLQGECGLDCGNFTAIFSYLAERSGLCCRTIGTGRTLGGAGLGSHVFLEIFVPELKQWVMVDPLARHFLFRNSSGKYLNALDIRARVAEDFWAQTEALHHDGDSLAWVPMESHHEVQALYLHRDNDLYYYKTTDPGKAYTSFQKIRRYFLPENWFFLHPYRSNTSLPFYLRACLAWTFLISGMVWAASKIRGRIMANSGR